MTDDDVTREDVLRAMEYNIAKKGEIINELILKNEALEAEVRRLWAVIERGKA